jgi:hypothetical protein
MTGGTERHLDRGSKSLLLLEGSHAVPVSPYKGILRVKTFGWWVLKASDRDRGILIIWWMCWRDNLGSDYVASTSRGKILMNISRDAVSTYIKLQRTKFYVFKTLFFWTLLCLLMVMCMMNHNGTLTYTWEIGKTVWETGNTAMFVSWFANSF